MNSFKLSVACLGAAVLLGGATLVFGASADALKSAPAPVQLAVIQLVGTNQITDFDSEVEGGKTVYDLEYKVKNASYEADIDPSGAILSREVEVDLSIIPPAVLDAAKKAHSDGKISEGSIVTAGDKMFYELDVKVAKDEHELQITAGGSVLADSIEAPEAPEAPEPGEKSADKEDKD